MPVHIGYNWKNIVGLLEIFRHQTSSRFVGMGSSFNVAADFPGSLVKSDEVGVVQDVFFFL